MATKKKTPPTAKAIEFDVLAHLKTMPQAFWLKVPTASEAYRCEGMKYEEYRRENPNDYYSKRFELRPAFCDEFPEFEELHYKFLRPSQANCYDPAEEYEYKDRRPLHDWIECVIGPVRLRYNWMPGWANHGWYATHEDFNGVWGELAHFEYTDVNWKKLPGNPRAKGKQDEWDKKSYYGDLVSAGLYNKTVATLWNKLRKKARQDAGVDLPPKKAAEAAAKKRAARLVKARKAVLKHVDVLLTNLQEYRNLVENSPETITVDRVREIFDDTNHMTSVNAELKKALGIQ